jgi:hypothetical protein
MIPLIGLISVALSATGKDSTDLKEAYSKAFYLKNPDLFIEQLKDLDAEKRSEVVEEIIRAHFKAKPAGSWLIHHEGDRVGRFFREVLFLYAMLYECNLWRIQQRFGVHEITKEEDFKNRRILNDKGVLRDLDPRVVINALVSGPIMVKEDGFVGIRREDDPAEKLARHDYELVKGKVVLSNGLETGDESYDFSESEPLEVLVQEKWTWSANLNDDFLDNRIDVTICRFPEGHDEEEVRSILRKAFPEIYLRSYRSLDEEDFAKADR